MRKPAQRRAGAEGRNGAAGQAMIESVIVLFFLCLLFFLVFQYANLLTVRTVLDHAAARAARARAVGFNDFMVTKTVRIASMSIAGDCRTDAETGEHLSTAALISRSGSYLQSLFEADTRGILDFELWDSDKLGWSAAEPGGEQTELTLRVWQKHPSFNFWSPAEDDSLFTMNGEAEIESHYPYYMK